MASMPRIAIRDYRPEDFAAVKALHEASGIDYALPELSSPLFFVAKVREVDGVVTAALALRIEAEAYLWCGGRDRDKLQAMRELQPAVMAAAWLAGIDNAVCWIPEAVEARFSGLAGLGWKRDRDGWHSWSRPTKV